MLRAVLLALGRQASNLATWVQIRWGINWPLLRVCYFLLLQVPSAVWQMMLALGRQTSKQATWVQSSGKPELLAAHQVGF